MKKVVLAFVYSLFCHFIIAQPTLQFVLAHTGFNDPVDISNAGDGSNRLFVVEKAGIVKIIEDGNVIATPFLDISSIVNSTASERGMLGIEFHPDYESNGYFFVNYTNLSGTTTISRFDVSAGNANLADASSEKIMLQISQPFNNHNAGDLKFSPVDNYLYIPMGDGGSGGDPGCRSQDSTLLLGKLLRIDVDQNVNTPPYYGIPPDNPYLSNATVPDEIWAFGLRNPWKFCFDSKNGDMWIADVGQGNVEEVNTIDELTPRTGAVEFELADTPADLVRTLDGVGANFAPNDRGFELAVTDDELDVVVDRLRAAGVSIRGLVRRRLNLEQAFIDTVQGEQR